MLAVKLFVERTALTQHAFDNLGGDAPRGEPRRFGVHRLMRTHHATAVTYSGDCVWRRCGDNMLAPLRVSEHHRQTSRLCADADVTPRIIARESRRLRVAISQATMR